MTWGDFDKDGRADLAFARGTGNLIPSTTDVWLNRTDSNPICSAPSGLRELSLCARTPGFGKFQIRATPLDSRLIHAMQIYIDGTLKFETPDDLLNTNLQLSAGQHRVTAKAWDDLGPFSDTTFVVADAPCTNTASRTVKICSPQDGAVLTTEGKQAPVAHVVATAATDLKFTAIQVYVDGKLKYQSSVKSVDIQISLLTSGPHRIAVKGWDSSGAFSSAVTVTVN